MFGNSVAEFVSWFFVNGEISSNYRKDGFHLFRYTKLHKITTRYVPRKMNFNTWKTVSLINIHRFILGLYN